jgi:hypothetical protein
MVVTNTGGYDIARRAGLSFLHKSSIFTLSSPENQEIKRIVTVQF